MKKKKEKNQSLKQNRKQSNQHNTSPGVDERGQQDSKQV
jgi:hypothetical protein